MGRNCYTKADVEKFRAAVVKYIVPLADSIYREQAGRLGQAVSDERSRQRPDVPQRQPARRATPTPSSSRAKVL